MLSCRVWAKKVIPKFEPSDCTKIKSSTSCLNKYLLIYGVSAACREARGCRDGVLEI